MKRRDFVLAAGGTALTGLIGTYLARAGSPTTATPSPTTEKRKRRPLSKAARAVVDTTSDCIKKGEICVAECTAVLQSGNTSMADCQTAVQNMLAICGAVMKLVAYNTADESQLKALAKSCSEFCRACEKECRVHSEHHKECKDCMESCIACAKACDAYASA